MIKKLHVENFKSIKNLDIDCSRVNIFIGEPNTGKSNILESVGILSFPYTFDLKDFVRYSRISNIFYNSDINIPIKVTYTVDVNLKSNLQNITPPNVEVEHNLIIDYSIDNVFEIKASGADFLNSTFNSTYRKTDGHNIGYSYSETSNLAPPLIRFFRFKKIKFEKSDMYVLKPPDGSNLMNVIQTNKEIRQFAAELIAPFDFKFRLSTESGNIEFSREYENVIFDFPFELLSDTFIRMIMLFAAIETSQKHVLVLEEPETHVFPFYNEQLALLVANNANQFFIATHNPYFLNMVINKTPTNDLKVFKITYKDSQTLANPIDKNTLQKFVINDNDILLNIDKLEEN